ncbi:hypothetical protein HY480_03470 [Candidatus Uhrbacteria bacterium]|nr:hypothetical protein [Candidatus Uhrbacteria bacterium]
MPDRIVVGISGGVDSALAAALLQERGFDVLGCYLKVVIPDAPCPWKEDLPMAHRVAAHLNVPLIVKDISTEYKREVLEPMIDAYRAGDTPNPDILCNRWVKFDALLAVAREIGADRIATGHYARICSGRALFPSADDRANKRGLTLYATGSDPVYLLRGLDHSKDQSYFLATLTQEQLAACEFPLGEWQKEDVRAEAKRRGLPNWDRHSTSGVCFLGHTDIATFLASRSAATPATVVTTTGDIVGTVPAGEALTIGQRAPIAGQSTPRYVVARDCPKPSFGQSHRVVVSAAPDDPARFVQTFTTTAPHWINDPPPPNRGGAGGGAGLRCTVRIRHRQEPVPCTVFLPSSFRPSASNERVEKSPGDCRRSLDCAPAGRSARDDEHMSALRVTLSTPLTGVAPGQAAVFTDGDRILGAATIDASGVS